MANKSNSLAEIGIEIWSMVLYHQFSSKNWVNWKRILIQWYHTNPYTNNRCQKMDLKVNLRRIVKRWIIKQMNWDKYIRMQGKVYLNQIWIISELKNWSKAQDKIQRTAYQEYFKIWISRLPRSTQRKDLGLKMRIQNTKIHILIICSNRIREHRRWIANSYWGIYSFWMTEYKCKEISSCNCNNTNY